MVSPGVALTFRGAPGTVAGITGADGTEEGPVPAAFAAVTENVYEVPFVRPVTVQPLVVAEHVLASGELVTVYPVI